MTKCMVLKCITSTKQQEQKMIVTIKNGYSLETK